MADKQTEKARVGRKRGPTVWRRISICIPDDVVRHVEAVAALDGVTRSACITRACRAVAPLPPPEPDDTALRRYLERVGGRYIP